MASGADVAHVVYVWPYTEWGGAQRYFISHMRRLHGRMRVTVILPDASDHTLVAELAALGAAVLRVRGRLRVTPPRGLAARVRDHLAAWRVQAALRRACLSIGAVDTVFHCDVPLTFFARWLGALARRHAVVVTLHTSLATPARWRAGAWRWKLTRLVARPTFRLVAANRHVRDSLRPYLPAAAVAAIPLAYSPVEAVEVAAARAVARADTRRWLGVGDGRCLVVTGAQFIARKGRAAWLAAAALVRAQAGDVDFLWIGPQPLGASDSVLLAGRAGVRYLAQGDLPQGRASYLEAIAAADIFVLPSLEDGLPLALVEALALGVPVVTTPVNAIPEAVTHDVHGWLVPPGDASALAEAVLALHADPARARRLAAAGREHARIFDADAVVATTTAVYAQTLAVVETRGTA